MITYIFSQLYLYITKHTRVKMDGNIHVARKNCPPSIHHCLSWFASWKQQHSKWRHPNLPLTGHLLQLIHRVATEAFSSQSRDIILQWVLGLPRSLLPVEYAENTSPRKCLIRCPYHLIRLLLMWRSSGSSVSSSQMTELLTLSLKREASHSSEKANFCHLYRLFHSFGPYSEFVTIVDGVKVEVQNRQLLWSTMLGSN